MKSKIWDVVFIVLILLIGFYNVKEFGGFGTLPFGDAINSYYPRATILKESIFKYGNFFPLWQPYMMGGTPYQDGLGVDIISYFGILNLFIPTPVTVVGLTYMFSYLLSGVSMYFLARYLLKERKYAFLAALVFMLSGYATTRFNEGTHQLSALSVLPLAFLFLVKIFKEKDWVKNSVICGILVALQLKVAPDIKVTLFMSLIFTVFVLFQLIGNNFKARVVKVGISGAIILIVIFGLTAHQLLVQKENIESSARSGLAYEESSRRATPILDLFSQAVEPFNQDTFKIRPFVKLGGIFKIGLFAFLLGIYAIIRKPKNKFILFLIATTIVAMLIATASPFFYFLWKYVPPWGSFRYVSRSFVMWSFSGALLAGYGLKFLSRDVKRKYGKKAASSVFVAAVVLVVLNLAFFIRIPIAAPTCDLNYLLDKADALQYLKEIKESDNEIFRIHDIETTGIDWPTDAYTVTMRLEHLFGQTAIWQVDYMNVFLSLAFREPAKFWGIMNVKYITSRKPLELKNLELVKEFERFESDGECPPFNASTWNDPYADAGMKAFGQFVYENKDVMPRAYMVEDAILIVGKHDNIMNLMYALLLDPNFNLKKAAVIYGKEQIGSYEVPELQKYKAIFLTEGSVDNSIIFKLQEYVNSGGVLIPDIVNNKNQIADEDIAKLYSSLDVDFKPIEDSDIITKNFEEKKIKTDSKGFLIVSELYQFYDPWRATKNSKDLEILRANGVISAVYVGGPGEVIFRFRPKSLLPGRIITIVTIIILLLYFFRKRLFSKFVRKHK